MFLEKFEAVYCTFGHCSHVICISYCTYLCRIICIFFVIFVGVLFPTIVFLSHFNKCIFIIKGLLLLLLLLKKVK
jgi:hypothetical protein